MGHVPDEFEHDADERGGRNANGLSGATQSKAKQRAFGSLLVCVALVTSALGAWQLERRVWKLDLISAVNARVHAPPEPAPGPSEWPAITGERDAYRHVSVQGQFDYRDEIRVWAATGRGEGYWLLTPLRTPQGWSVLINRGFVPAGETRIVRPRGTVFMSGLLRMTEPGGTFMRSNDPPAGRWYSRDVKAMVGARRLRRTAPYFIDAEVAGDPAAFPVAGMTVVSFRNAHFSYAVTWFTLAGLSLVGLWLLFHKGRKGS